MKFWELYQTGGVDDAGNRVTGFVAELYEQPLWARLRGIATFWLWMHCPRWVTNHHGQRRRLNFELAWTDGIPRAHRRSIEWVQVKDRDPDTWWKPGGDLPWTSDTSADAPSGSASAPSGTSPDGGPPAS